MSNKFKEGDQIVQWINKINCPFYQHKNVDFSIFLRYLSTKFQGSKKHFYGICYCYISVLFNEKG